MKCLYCQKDLDNPRAKFCDAKHKMAFRRGDRVININEVSVTNDRNKTSVTESSVTLPLYKQSPELYYQGEITPEVEKKLKLIYKQYEKENKGFKCEPYMSKGKQILTLWERSKLKQMENVVAKKSKTVSLVEYTTHIPKDSVQFFPEFTPGYCVKCRAKKEVKIMEYDNPDTAEVISEALCKKHVEELQKFLEK